MNGKLVTAIRNNLAGDTFFDLKLTPEKLAQPISIQSKVSV